MNYIMVTRLLELVLYSRFIRILGVYRLNLRMGLIQVLGI